MINEREFQIAILAALVFDEKGEYITPSDLDGIKWASDICPAVAGCIKHHKDGIEYDLIMLNSYVGMPVTRWIAERITTSMSALRINAQHYVYELKKQQAEDNISNKVEMNEQVTKEDVQRLVDISNKKTEEPIHNFSESILAYLDQLDLKISGKYEKYNTGIPELDDKLGNIEPGAFITIGGLSGLSKTNFALRLFCNLVLENVKCLYLSSEMTYSQLLDRMIAMMSGKDADTNLSAYGLKNGRVNEIERKQVDIIIEKYFYKKEYQYIFPTARFDIGKITQRIEKCKTKVVFLDFIQQYCEDKGDNRANAMSEMARQLKEIAMNTGTIVFALSQVNDKGQMKDSRGIDEKSDVVLTMVQTSDDDTEKKFDLLITKNRYGDNGKIPMILNRRTCNIEPDRKGGFK